MGIYVTIESETDAGVWREYAGKISSALGQAIIEASSVHREWSNEVGRFFLVPAGEITDPQQVATLWYKLCRQLEKPRKLLPDANGDLHRHVRCRQALFELAKRRPEPVEGVIQEALALEEALQAANTTGAAIEVRWG